MVTIQDEQEEVLVDDFTPRLLTYSDILRVFPNLKREHLNYLVQRGVIECQCRGGGKLRLYTPESIDQIMSYDLEHDPSTLKFDQNGPSEW